MEWLADPQIADCGELRANIDQRDAVALPGRNTGFLKQLSEFMGMAAARRAAALATVAKAHCYPMVAA